MANRLSPMLVLGVLPPAPMLNMPPPPGAAAPPGAPKAGGAAVGAPKAGGDADISQVRSLSHSRGPEQG